MDKNIRILLFCVLVLLVMSISVPISSLYNFKHIEQQEITRDTKQGLNIIKENVRQITTIADDYAGWDDAYAFIQGKNPQFIIKNIGEDFYSKLSINIFMIINNDNTVIYQHAFDYRKKQPIPLPPSLQDHIRLGKPLVSHASITSFKSGLLSLPEGILLIVSRPVLTSKYQGPIKGVMIFGRFLDQEEVERLAKMIQLRLKVFNTPEANTKLLDIVNHLRDTDAIHCRIEEEDVIAAYARLVDIYGEDAGILKVENTRRIYHQAKDHSRWSLLIYGATAAIFTIVLILQGRKLMIIRHNDIRNREALIAKQLELETLNNTLEKKVADEVTQNREKDRIMMHQSRLAAMGEIIGNIAHQWRQPLNHVGLIIQKIELEHEMGELTGESVKSMVSESMKYILFMSNTIDDFRNFFNPAKEETLFSLSEAITRSISLVGASARNNDIDLRFHDEGCGMTRGHANEFTQVILNLINNSIDALLVTRPSGPFVELRCFSCGSQSVVTVQDNAGGIDEAIREKIFEPYFTTKYKSLGTGIGLYMAKMIIENNMGGTLTARNIEAGAELRIELEVQSEWQPDRSAAAPENGGVATGAGSVDPQNTERL